MYHLIYLSVCLAPLAICSTDTSIIESHKNWQYLGTEHCGINRIDKKHRIINGEQAALGQFPWIARLGQQQGRYTFFDCGGSLVNQYYVISAAHCGEDHEVVRLGENNLHTDNQLDCDETGCVPPVQDIPVEKSILFGYNSTNHRNDLMLLKLAHPATLNEFVWPVCLPYGALLTKDLLGAHVQIAGWGYVDRDGENIPSTLMYFTGPVLKTDDCNNIYKRPLDPETQYCVGYPKNEPKDSCAGDSGGPMTKYEHINGSRRHFLLGVVSYGLKKCGDGPAVYTRLIHYLPELLDAIEQ